MPTAIQTKEQKFLMLACVNGQIRAYVVHGFEINNQTAIVDGKFHTVSSTLTLTRDIKHFAVRPTKRMKRIMGIK